MGSIFGGSKSKQSSESYNKAYDTINSSLSPVLGNAQNGSNALLKLLGGDTSGLDTFKNAMGYDWQLGQGTDDILSKRAAVGGLDSGATLKGLAKYQTGLNNQYGQTYLDTLFKQADLGFNAANSIGGVGNYNKSTGSSSSKPGLGGLVGAIGSKVAASDYRLKDNVRLLYTLPNGLNVYEYEYKTGFGLPEGKQTGVMADEVKQLMPEALGPEWNGYMTVDYSKIGDLHAA